MGKKLDFKNEVSVLISEIKEEISSKYPGRIIIPPEMLIYTNSFNKLMLRLNSYGINLVTSANEFVTNGVIQVEVPRESPYMVDNIDMNKEVPFCGKDAALIVKSVVATMISACCLQYGDPNVLRFTSNDIKCRYKEIDINVDTIDSLGDKFSNEDLLSERASQINNIRSVLSGFDEKELEKFINSMKEINSLKWYGIDFDEESMKDTVAQIYSRNTADVIDITVIVPESSSFADGRFGEISGENAARYTEDVLRKNMSRSVYNISYKVQEGLHWDKEKYDRASEQVEKANNLMVSAIYHIVYGN